MGEHPHQYKASGEEMEISLGVDGEVKVERKPITHKDKKGSLLDSKQHLPRGYVIALRNTSSQSKRIEVRENIPVSKINDIRIELLKKETTDGYTLDAERGFISWNVTVAPNQRKDDKESRRCVEPSPKRSERLRYSVVGRNCPRLHLREGPTQPSVGEYSLEFTPLASF